MSFLRRELALALTLGVSSVSGAFAQFDDADWEVLLPQNRLVDVTIWQDQIVGADALGGLLFYDPDASTLTPFTAVDGLATNRTTSLFVDDQQRLWVGTADAFILRLEPDGPIRTVSSQLAGLGEIRAIDQDGAFVYYASASGGGVISGDLPEQQFARDQGLPSNDVVDVAAFAGRAWFATDAGVGFFDRAANEVGTLNTGLPGPNVTAVAAGPDGVFAAVDRSVLRLDESDADNPVWVTTTPEPGLVVLDIEVADGELVVLGNGSRLRIRDLEAANWEFIDEDGAAVEWLAVHRAVDGEVWTAGRRTDRALEGRPRSITRSTPLFWSESTGNSPELPFRVGESARGMVGDGQGGVWVGFSAPEDALLHWRADGSIQSYALMDSLQQEGEGDGWLTGEKFAMDQAPNGDYWIGSFAATGGLTRFRPDPSGDPTQASYFHLRVSDDLLKTRRILDLDVDARGWVWVASDGEFGSGQRNLGIDVLVDPGNPTSPDAWVKITAANSGLAGDAVTAITVDGDVVWMGVSGTGLQRFDLTGAAEDLVNARTQPSRWDTIERLPEGDGAIITSVTDVEIGPDGRVWVTTGDRGAFVFAYSIVSVGSGDVERFEQSEFGESLVSNQLRRVTVVGPDEAWIAGVEGLHRVAIEDDQTVIDPFVDTGYFLAGDLIRRFGERVIAPVPNASVRAVWRDDDRDLLYVGTDLGLARVRLRGQGDTLPDAFDVTLSPNPIRDEDTLQVSDFEGTLDAFIYTLGGRLISTATAVTDGDRIWDTRSVLNDRVVSGLYLVRLVRSDGAEIVRTVAIER